MPNDFAAQLELLRADLIGVQERLRSLAQTVEQGRGGEGYFEAGPQRPANKRLEVVPLAIADPEAARVAAGVGGAEHEAGPGISEDDLDDFLVSVELADDPGLEFDATGNAGKVRLIRADSRYNAMVANAADLVFKAGWIRAH